MTSYYACQSARRDAVSSCAPVREIENQIETRRSNRRSTRRWRRSRRPRAHARLAKITMHFYGYIQTSLLQTTRSTFYFSQEGCTPLLSVASNVCLLNFLSSPVPLALDVPFCYGEDFCSIGRPRAAPDDSKAPKARGDRPEPAQRKTIDSLGRLSTLDLGHGFRDARGLRPAAHGPRTHPGHQRCAPRPAEPPPATSQRIRSSPCTHIMYTST